MKEGGTIINDEDADSNTALHLASTYGHHRVIEALLEKGAVIDARLVNLESDVSKVDNISIEFSTTVR